MAKKTGVCANIDCDHYKESFEIEAGGEFECPYCHQPLREAAGKHGGKKDGGGGNGNGKKIALIVAIAVVLGIGITVLVKCCGNSSKTGSEQIDDGGKTDGTDSIRPDTTTLLPVNPPGEKPGKDDGKGKGKDEPEPLPPGAVDLGYAIYEGDLKNGKPHGKGILTYKREQKIVSSKDFVAKPGDKFDGEFRNGRISSQGGYWIHDGNQTYVKP